MIKNSMSLAEATRTSEVEVGTFPAPCEFLGDFVDEAEAYSGLYQFLGQEIEDGHADKLRAFADEMTLDIGKQGEYSSLIRSLQEQRFGRSTLMHPVHPAFHPQLDASIAYLKYRLALGIMTPALDTALWNTNPDHSRVRAERTVVATALVAEFIEQSFSEEAYQDSRPTSFLEADARGYVSQFFNDAYTRTRMAGGYVIEHGLDGHSTQPLIPVGPDTDDFRLFDIKDFSGRLFHLRRDSGTYTPRLPNTDEYEYILNGQLADSVNAAKSWQVMESDDVLAESSMTHTDRDHIRLQVLAEVFEGLGLLPTNHSALANLGKLDHFLPGGLHLEGRQFVAATARSLLIHIQNGSRVTRINRGPGRRLSLKEQDREVVVERLESLVGEFGDKWMPVDALFRLCEEQYIRVHGDIPATRDFQDSL